MLMYSFSVRFGFEQFKFREFEFGFMLQGVRVGGLARHPTVVSGLGYPVPVSIDHRSDHRTVQPLLRVRCL